MTEVTLHLPEDLSVLMGKYRHINWSNIAAEAIRKTIAELELLDSIASQSKLTEEDAIALGKKVKKGMWKKVYEKLV